MAETSQPGRRRSRSAFAVVLAALLGYAALAIVHSSAPMRAVRGLVVPPVGDADAFVAGKRAESARLGARAEFEERLVRAAPGRTRLGLVYLHGFGAGRGEGEGTFDPLAAELGANLYYARLPGHGESPDAHAARRFEEYVITAEQSLAVGRAIGERVVLVATSTGALLATWLAAEHPGEIAALVVASPLYDYARRDGALAGLPGVLGVVGILAGPNRDVSWRTDPEHRKLEGYDTHWMPEQRWSALAALDDLRRLVMRDEVLARVRAPVLLMHTTQERDGTVSVAAMARTFARFNGGTPARASRVVRIDDGSHVLTSAFVRTDKARVHDELRAFLRDAGLAD